MLNLNLYQNYCYLPTFLDQSAPLLYNVVATNVWIPAIILSIVGNALELVLQGKLVTKAPANACLLWTSFVLADVSIFRSILSIVVLVAKSVLQIQLVSKVHVKTLVPNSVMVFALIFSPTAIIVAVATVVVLKQKFAPKESVFAQNPLSCVVGSVLISKTTEKIVENAELYAILAQRLGCGLGCVQIVRA